MRALLAAVLVLAAAVLLAACGSEEEKEPTATSTPTAGAAATATARATETPRVTPVPTVVATQTPVALEFSWQTSAPREPVAAGTTVELGIRNKNGAPGETDVIQMVVLLPDQRTLHFDAGDVSGDAWTYFYISDTSQAGTYKVLFGRGPWGDPIYAEDSFEVSP
jgi:hypothetical protein